MLGSSGVGKSTLLNNLSGKQLMKTNAISTSSNKGQHVTSHRELVVLENGGILIDNPGMREVGMTDVGDGIDSLFDEITSLARKCKYVDCTHIHEPGCAVLSAIKSGRLDKDRYNNYLGLKKETEYYEMTELEKKQKNSQFGKFVKKTKKELRRYGHKDY